MKELIDKFILGKISRHCQFDPCKVTDHIRYVARDVEETEAKVRMLGGKIVFPVFYATSATGSQQ